jgi:hypothetical protein
MDLNNLKEEAKTNKGTALLQEKLSLIKQRCEELQVALDFNLNSVNKVKPLFKPTKTFVEQFLSY